MCGIIAALAQRPVVPILIEGLKRLEYRGYDSAGIAVLDSSHDILRVRKKGKVAVLEEALTPETQTSHIGIAHTRWATHGEPSEKNAHPHNSNQQISLVHNGIIENHSELREELQADGYLFESETDTEVIVHLIHREVTRLGDFMEGVRAAAQRFEGAYALAILNKDEPTRMIALRKGSPLLMGIGIDEYFLASDTAALTPVTHRFIFLHDGDFVEITSDHYEITDNHGQPVEREIVESDIQQFSADKGKYKHYMLKEIYEQPVALRKTLENRITPTSLLQESIGQLDSETLARVEHIHIVACGTSYHAGFVARYWFEKFTPLTCSVEVASEYRYRKVSVPPNTLYVTISQSGETADSLAALSMVKKRGYLGALVICNVPESSMVREADASMLTHAGPEIGVASTKAFTTQLAALLMLVAMLGKAKGIPQETLEQLLTALSEAPSLVEAVLELDKDIQKLAEDFVEKSHAIFLGRGPFYPVALEGALKLKEISYIHSEGYPAGELKHGPLALIDTDIPVVAVAPKNDLIEKLKSNLEEVRTRGGQLYIIAEEGVHIDENKGIKCIRVPHCPAPIAPIIFSIPLQLLSYHVAVTRGTDVDQPRNLAKSVTVE
ncbi:MAG: glutamine--fructose-6-phosphate transaminase (isomerizing) [Gammaproteobacteria bacterium]|nr:glutamine--fructose-6-phosphate transaminase (isomerizing) [Gammaproteobacteria bacterium]